MKTAIQRLYHNNVTIKALAVVSNDGRVRDKPEGPHPSPPEAILFRCAPGEAATGALPRAPRL